MLSLYRPLTATSWRIGCSSTDSHCVNRFLQIAAVSLALFMLAGYVVYSQRQAQQRAEPNKEPVVASSSKVKALLVRPLTTPAAATSNVVKPTPPPGLGSSESIAYGSKSAPVFPAPPLLFTLPEAPGPIPQFPGASNPPANLFLNLDQLRFQTFSPANGRTLMFATKSAPVIQPYTYRIGPSNPPPALPQPARPAQQKQQKSR